MGKRLEQFMEILTAQRGECAAMLVLRRDGKFEAELRLPDYPVQPSAEMEETVHALFGRMDVVALA